MTDPRRQLRNAKKLVRLRLVEQRRASMQVAEARERLRQSNEALSAAKRAIEGGDATFRQDAAQWNSISSFEAALERRNARTEDAKACAEAARDHRTTRDRAIDELRAHDVRLSAAEQLVLVHRGHLRRALERLEQVVADDLSALKKSRDS